MVGSPSSGTSTYVIPRLSCAFLRANSRRKRFSDSSPQSKLARLWARVSFSIFNGQLPRFNHLPIASHVRNKRGRWFGVGPEEFLKLRERRLRDQHAVASLNL